MATSAAGRIESDDEKIFRAAIRHAFKEQIQALDMKLRKNRTEWKTLLNRAVDDFFDDEIELVKRRGPSDVRLD